MKNNTREEGMRVDMKMGRELLLIIAKAVW